MSRHLPSLVASSLLGAALALIGYRHPPISAPPAAFLPEQTPRYANESGAFAPDHTSPTTSMGGDVIVSSGAYAAAWKSLHDGTRAERERRYIQGVMLKEWCTVDFGSALKAAIAEGDFAAPYPISSDGDGNELDGSLLDACNEAIALRTDDVWDLIQKQEFGLDTRRLRSKWIQIMVRDQPVKLMEKLPDLPREDREMILHNLHGRLDASTMVKFLDQQDPGLRRMYEAAFISFLRDLPAEERKQALGSLPDALRAKVKK